MSFSNFARDVDDEEDDSSQDQDSDDQTNDTSDTSNVDDQQDDGSAIAGAAPHEQDAHRNMIGEALKNLSDRGIDVDSLAEKAGVSSGDVNELEHGDLSTMTKYLAQNHPEALQSVAGRFPAAQGILSSVTGGQGGMFGGMLGKLFGG